MVEKPSCGSSMNENLIKHTVSRKKVKKETKPNMDDC